MRLSEQQEKILRTIEKEGAISVEEGKEIYDFTQNFYRGLKDMVEKNLVEKNIAPESSEYLFVWTFTERGRALTKSF